MLVQNKPEATIARRASPGQGSATEADKVTSAIELQTKIPSAKIQPAPQKQGLLSDSAKAAATVQARGADRDGFANAEEWRGQDINKPPGTKAPSLSEGRVTIAVDFPTEGEPLHFKKVKGAARLSLIYQAPERDHPWRNAAFLGVAAVALRLVQRRVVKER
jgi:hypothetical protein